MELLAPFDLSISIIYPDGRHLVSKMDRFTKESMYRNPNDRYEFPKDLSALWQEEAPKVLCRIDEAVSYTHLDVYKRQSHRNVRALPQCQVTNSIKVKIKE